MTDPLSLPMMRNLGESPSTCPFHHELVLAQVMYILNCDIQIYTVKFWSIGELCWKSF